MLYIRGVSISECATDYTNYGEYRILRYMCNNLTWYYDRNKCHIKYSSRHGKRYEFNSKLTILIGVSYSVKVGMKVY